MALGLALFAGFTDATAYQPRRTYSPLTRTSPFTTDTTFDAYAQPVAQETRAIDTAFGFPFRTSEGNTYCGGSWDAARCGGPLFRWDTVREGKGALRTS